MCVCLCIRENFMLRMILSHKFYWFIQRILQIKNEKEEEKNTKMFSENILWKFNKTFILCAYAGTGTLAWSKEKIVWNHLSKFAAPFNFQIKTIFSFWIMLNFTQIIYSGKHCASQEKSNRPNNIISTITVYKCAGR